MLALSHQAVSRRLTFALSLVSLIFVQPAPAQSSRVDMAEMQKAAARVQEVLDKMQYKPGVQGGGARRERSAAKPAYSGLDWSYAGDTGPDNWAKLKREYALCGAGKRQSPIDIRDAIPIDQNEIKIDYQPGVFRLTDTGHTLKVDGMQGDSIQLLGHDYALQEVTFHRPAEEKVKGKSADMSVDLIHRDSKGNIVVLVVLLMKSTENPAIQTLWNNIPLETGTSVSPPDTLLNLNDLLPPPDKRTYMSYMGSLTTPPCVENVLRIVFNQAMPFSPLQDAIFARLYPLNARPVQPTNNRLIKMSR